MSSNKSGLTALGFMASGLLIIGLLAAGVYVAMTYSRPAPAGPGGPSGARPGDSMRGPVTVPPSTDPGLAGLNLTEPMSGVPMLAASAAYAPTDGVIDVELSEYAGYAGLIVANGGLEPTEDSVFFKRHGFKVRLTLSEEESWSALNAGKMAASATTVDVLAVYGRQFQVVVPAQIAFSRGADAIVVNKKFRRLNDLAGQTLVASQFTEAEFFLRFLAGEAGIGVHVRSDLEAPPVGDKINLVFAEDAFVAGDLFQAELAAEDPRLAGCVTWEPKPAEILEEYPDKAHVLASNRNLLVIADVLIVNRPFAEANPKVVAGLVDGLMEGNRLLREDAEPHLAAVSGALGWEVEETREELKKVHFSNLPENLAFFSGAIDMAGSFEGIFQSAVYTYGRQFIPNPVNADRFVDAKHLEALKAGGAYANQRIQIAPISSNLGASVENDPLLTRDIRFFFQPNSADLDLASPENLKNLESIRDLLRVSPGSTLLLRGHVDNAMIEEFRKQGGEPFVRQMAMKAMELSKNRASEIRRLLIERHQVEEARIEIVGLGWDEPVSDVPERNRRVEVQWFTVE